MATLTVGAGKQYASIGAAVAAAKDGDTVAVSAGTYANDYATVKTRISLVAVGGPVTMTSTAPVSPAKALLTVTADATIDGFAFTNMRSADGVGAGVLVQSGVVTVRNSQFSGNQNGLLATANAATAVTILTSTFARNGNGDGFTANVQAGAIASLTIRDSDLHDAAGAELRSRAAATVVTGTRLADNAAASLYAVDLPAGGAVTLTGNVIEKGAASSVAAVVRYGSESMQAGSSLTIGGNTVVTDRGGAVLLQNLGKVVASVAANTVWGLAAMASGPAAVSATVVAATRPATTAPASVVAPPVEYGRAGAVVASGRILTVGAGQAYATVRAALAAAADGDTIRVQAGTYVNDGGVIAHKVIIEGVGGTARFVAPTLGSGPDAGPDSGPDSGAVFVTQADATVRNVEVFGAATPGGVAAAIAVQAGVLTVVNSSIHDNQAGIVGEAGASAIGIYDTEIARNGTADGRGGNVSVASIGTLVLRNDYVHDAVAGPEIMSLARATVLEGDRVSQAAGRSGAVVSLPRAGQVSIGNSAIQSGGMDRGSVSTPAPLVQIGGGPVYAGSVVTLAKDTFIVAASTVAPFVASAAGSAAVTMSVADSVFVGGAAGAAQVAGGSNTGASVQAGLTVATAAPNGAGTAPAPAALTVGPVASGPAANGQLVLFISGTAWHGNAQYTLMVDGVPVGGTLSAVASHAAGQSQKVVVAGSYAPGAHVVSVTFTNSLGQGTDGRSLSIDGMLFNGENLQQTATLTANGTVMLATAAVTRPVLVTVNLSEDAWKGDALAFVSIDGRVMGGVQTVTASHAAGQTMGLSFLTDLAPGAHTAAVTFLNGTGVLTGTGGGRMLYVDSIDVAGQHYAGAAATLDAGGSSHFAFTVAPPAMANGSLFVTGGLVTDLMQLLPTS